jgi:hypothetical protein
LATGLFVPKITDLAAVPTKKVQENDNDDDDTAVIFAMITLPSDKCNPLPKPKADGLLGVVANVANKVIDTVMNAACQMEFPVIEGTYPPWLNFGNFPAFQGYTQPADPEDPDDDPDENPSSSSTPTSTSSNSSSSSSCSAAAITNC